MPAKNCTHINVTGVRCGSPALRGERFCYYHQRVHRGVREPRNSRLHPIAQLDSPEAIQASLMEVLNAIVRNEIDLKRAGLLIRGLHIASKNIHRVYFNIHTSEMVREVPEQAEPPASSPGEVDPFKSDPVQEIYQIPYSDSVVIQQTKMHEEIIQRGHDEILRHRDKLLAQRAREKAAAEAAAAAASSAASATAASPPESAPETPKLNPVPSLPERKPPIAVTTTEVQPQSIRKRARSG